MPLVKCARESCNHVFSTVAEMHEHLKSFHGQQPVEIPEVETGPYACGVGTCDAELPTERGRNVHRVLKHGVHGSASTATHKVQVGGSGSGLRNEEDETGTVEDTEGGDMPQIDSDASDTDGHDDGQPERTYETRLIARFYQPVGVQALADLLGDLDVFVRGARDGDGVEIVERVET